MKTSDFYSTIEKIAPPKLAEVWDNSGIQLDFGNPEVNRVLVAMEVTDKVIDEAIAKNADMLLVHHPLIFIPVKKFLPEDHVANYIIRLIREGIPVYSAHTTFDSAVGGNNDYLLEKLGCRDIDRIEAAGRSENDPPIVKLGVTDEGLKLSDFCAKLKTVLGSASCIKVTGDPERVIRKVALCTGGGGEFWEDACRAGADLFISGDIRHHEAQGAKERGMCLIDAGHWGTENLFVPNMCEKLKKAAPGDLEVIPSEENLDPYNLIF